MSDYRMQHRAPGRTGAPLWDLTKNQVYPCDVYDDLRMYGDGHPEDAEAFRTILASRCKPDRMVQIYRAVPRSVVAAHRLTPIFAGDWIAIARGYAKRHALDLEGRGRDGVVVAMKVPAHAIWTDGNSLHEWGYAP